MFLFLKLVLAHLIGDFILQFEELYRLKVKSSWGHFFHALIHGVMSLLLAAPFIREYPWVAGYLVVLAVIHHFQDIIKYGLQAKHPKQIFWCFTIDQIVHFLFIATSLLLNISYKPLGFPHSPTLDFLYRDPWLTAYAIAFITCTFKATYFLHAIRKSFISGTRPNHFISSFEVWHCLLERGWITGWILFSNPLLAIPVGLLIGLTRLPSPLLKNRTDFFLSASYALITGFLFRLWIGHFS